MAFEQRATVRLLLRSVIVGLLALIPATAFAAPIASARFAPQELRAALRDCLERPPEAENLPQDKVWEALKGFYRARDFQPVWTSSPATDLVLAALDDASADGLDPQRYNTAALAARHELATPADAAQYDIVLTDGLLRYARDMYLGRIEPDERNRLVDIERSPFDPAAALTTALHAGALKSWLASLPPQHAEYRRLKDALARYRELVAKGGWPSVPVVRKIELEAGNPQLKALQARLAAEDPQVQANGPIDIPVLEDAVKRFQARNGLKIDGVVGAATIETLNISASERLGQIKANLERWRWLPRDLGTRYIAVNAAATTLQVVDEGRVVLRSRVITGKRRTPTPMFNAQVVAITVNPSWYVPVSIARNEILPKLRRNPGYLARHHMVMEGSPYRIRQLPGADNSLGYIKLEMPNRFSSYLHDTSTRRLFEKDDRHLSHGCMRVQQIRPLASFVLSGGTKTEVERINAAIATGRTQKIVLDRPVPVYVLYWTAVAQLDGSVDFYPDVYGRDAKLIAAFAGQRTQDTASLDAIGCRGWIG